LKLPGGRLIYVVIIVAILGVAGFLVYQQFMAKNYVELVNVDFVLESRNWRILRIIKVTIRNTGSDNATINSVTVNGRTLNTWGPRGLIIYPGEVKAVEIYYPWKGEECNVVIETNVGKVEFKKKSPEVRKISIGIQNTAGEDIDEIVSFGLFFADGEVKPGEVRVLDENGVEVLNQMWGIVTYQSGYVKTAVISFPLKLPKGGYAEYTLILGEKPTLLGSLEGVIIERTGEYTFVDNGYYRVRFNESDSVKRGHGSIDYFGNGKVNLAKIFKPKGAPPSGGLAFLHGFIDSMVESDGKMYAILQKTEIWVESQGPLLFVYARKWNLRTLGYAYEFYAIPADKPYMFYEAVFDVEHYFAVGPGAGKPGVGEADGRYYNPSGMGGMAVPHLAVVRALFFVIDTGDIYSPTYPGVDIWIKHPIAACRDYDLGAGIMLLANDPTNPLGYWHITLHKFPWYDWFGGIPGPEEEPAVEFTTIAGIHERMLCYQGQNIYDEPYAQEREVVPRGAVRINEGTYSWVFVVRAIFGEDAVTALKHLNKVYGEIELTVTIKD